MKDSLFAYFFKKNLWNLTFRMNLFSGLNKQIVDDIYVEIRQIIYLMLDCGFRFGKATNRYQQWIPFLFKEQCFRSKKWKTYQI